MPTVKFLNENTFPKIGVGLRHAHFEEALSSPAAIDFVEVHAENFFADGGVLHQILKNISEDYTVSLHATAMGLGSATKIPEYYVNQLLALTRLIDPFLISDHACFAWGNIGSTPVHAGDLLPIPYNTESLNIMVENVDQIQQSLGRKILVENLSAYIKMRGSTMQESEFLASLCEQTDCGLLIDLNNLLVNEKNAEKDQNLNTAKIWLDNIPVESVGEFHLAGFSQPTAGELAIDDHSQPVSDDGWALYEYALTQFGPVPTLIEWDNQLPSWQTLIDQAQKAKAIAKKVFSGG